MKTKTEQLKIRPQRELYVDGPLIKTRLVKVNFNLRKEVSGEKNKVSNLSDHYERFTTLDFDI